MNSPAISAAKRIPPIQCLLTFEALARLRSVTQAAEELFVTPSAVSHRVKQLEQILGTKLFGRADFSLTTEGIEYLAHVREGLTTLQKFPAIAGQSAAPGKRKLRVAVTPTFARAILIPRLPRFTEAYPEIDLTLQVSIPLLDVVAEDADLMIRFGSGRYADVEHVCLVRDEVTPMASPAFVREQGPFETPQDLGGPGPSALAFRALAHLVCGAATGLARADRGLTVQRRGLDVRCGRCRHGHSPGPAQAGHTLAGQRLADPPVSPDRAQPACPLPVLAHRHHGALGMQRLCAVAQAGGLG